MVKSNYFIYSNLIKSNYFKFFKNSILLENNNVKEAGRACVVYYFEKMRTRERTNRGKNERVGRI